MPTTDVIKPKRNRWTPVLATILLLLVITLVAILLWIALRPPVSVSLFDAVFMLLLLTFPAVGRLIAVRRPTNPLGWILLAFPLFLLTGVISEELGLRAVQEGSDSNVALLLIAGGGFQFLGYWLLIGPAILLFPDGKIPGKRFRWAFWGVTALLMVWGVLFAIGSETVCVGRFDDVSASPSCSQSVENPLALSGGASLDEALYILVMGIFVLTLATSVSAVILRYVRSTGDVRQQIKWVAWVAAAGLLTTFGLTVGQEVFELFDNDWVEFLAFLPLLAGLPIAIGFAILKYRLYDIDRIISRSAAYTLVALVLGAVYVLGVTLIQQIIPAQGQFDIVVSTLVVAALFNPLRRRVQDAVDRRFNRARYDAARVLEEFSSQLQDDVDLEQMQAALLGATQRTMQPSHVSLWIREPEPE